MRTIAKLASRLNWPRSSRATVPVFYLLTDMHRLADPIELLERLPRGGGVILRHTDAEKLEALARRTVPHAHRLGLKVLLAGDVRLALRTGCDGVHLSENQARSGPLRVGIGKPGFIVTAAAHGRLSLWRAKCANADLVFLSPVFPTRSHPDAVALGVLRFAGLAKTSKCPIAALGGVTPATARRLALGPANGLAAIDAWRL